MVYLNRIYTKSGDSGDTGLGDGSRVGKDDPRVGAIGGVDELNAALGVLLAQVPALPEADLLRTVQNDLFDVGADLCMPATRGEPVKHKLEVTADQVARLEQAIDGLTARLKPLTSFILPGGTPAAAWCHFARTACRRAEREVVYLSRTQPVNPELLKYLNRLSDFLFVLARTANDGGAADVLWVPGASQ